MMKKWTHTLIFLFFFAAAAQFSAQSVRAEATVPMYDKALAAYLQGDYQRSQTIVATLLKKHWHNYDVVMLAGYVSWKRGAVKWVEPNFQRAIQIKPQSIAPYESLINFYLEQGQNNKALASLQKAIYKFNNKWQAWNLAAMTYLKTKQWNRAQKSAEKAITLNSKNYQAYNLLGLVYLQQEKYNLAAIAFKSAHSLAPQSSYILNNLGVVMEKQKKMKQAREYYQKALHLNPAHPTAMDNLQRVKKNMS